MLEVAIIGGGVSGCYCAYRLAHSSKLDGIGLFEASDRIGGRLWSLQPLESEGVEGAPIELGGHWFGDGELNVFGLVTELDLKPKKIAWSSKSWFLRGVKLDKFDHPPKPNPPHDADCVGKVPYRLRPNESGKDPFGLLAFAIEGILGCKIADLWPTNTRQATKTRLQSVRVMGRPLWQWGFWNLLAEQVSPEAYELMLDGVGLTSIFRNSNAYDAIWLYLAEQAQGNGPYRLPGGYQSLPLELEKRCAGRVTFNRRHRLDRIERDGRDFVLHFSEPNGKKSKQRARRVILALPRHALKLIDMDYGVVGEDFASDLDAVLPIPACKVYLLFDQPWWEASKFAPMQQTESYADASYTDLPMRQCVFYRGELARNKALIMACYADDTAAGFWSALAKTTDCGEMGQKWLAPGAVACESISVRHAALRQLQAMFPDVTPDTSWRPYFQDWGVDPYGAAWHAWAPHYKSWEVRERMRQPHRNRALYICGESFAQIQGWVEGALNSAEMALRSAAGNKTTGFALDKPAWLGDDHVFEF